MEKVKLKKGQHLAHHTRVEIIRALIAGFVHSTGDLASDLLYNLAPADGSSRAAVANMRVVLQVRLAPIRRALTASGDWLAKCGACGDTLSNGEIVVPYGDNRYDCVGCAANGKGYCVAYYNPTGPDYYIKNHGYRVKQRLREESSAY